MIVAALEDRDVVVGVDVDVDVVGVVDGLRTCFRWHLEMDVESLPIRACGAERRVCVRGCLLARTLAVETAEHCWSSKAPEILRMQQRLVQDSRIENRDAVVKDKTCLRMRMREAIEGATSMWRERQAT